MRKVIEKIMCDRCGMEIIGNPVRITPHYVHRKGAEYKGSEEEINESPLWMMRLMNKEFCIECAKTCIELFWIKKENG